MLLLQLLESVASSSILTMLLKHLRQMLPYTRSFSSLTKPLLRILIKFWSTAEETVRVTAFLNILHIATKKESVLEKLLKVRSSCDRRNSGLQSVLLKISLF